MIPRKKLDIGWADLFRAFKSCLWEGDREALQSRLESAWSPEGTGLACLSVRSGLDALLHVLALPAGSEVAVSAVTIRDMVRILEAHGLVAVPVDLDMRRLSVDPASLARAITPRTRAVLAAHLFGSRMPMEPILEVARAHGLLVLEDCAQAYAGGGDRGHPESDVSFFSFGPIKTATALGGGLLRFRDRTLRDRVHRHQASWPVQSRWAYFQRVCKYCLLRSLSSRPVFSLFVSLCRMAGLSHDEIISRNVRGFAGEGFFSRIRQRPSFALLALLERRLRTYGRTRIAGRVSAARQAIELMPSVPRPGDEARDHTHWVFPVLCDAPGERMRDLWRKGFDATRGASSLYVVPPPEDRPGMIPAEARRTFERLLYLPVDAGLPRRDLERLAEAVAGPPSLESSRLAPFPRRSR